MPIYDSGKIRTIRQIIDELIRAGTVTRDGIKWLTIACDPWHDTPVEGIRGKPDQHTGKSVTFQVTQEIQISKPSFLGPGNWSVRISNNPYESFTQLVKGGVKGQVAYQDAPAVLYETGSVDVAYANDMAPDNGVFRNPTGPIAIPSKYLKGSVRVISKGIEVVNTTAEIYQQGMCSHCRYNQTDNEPFTGYISQPGAAGVWSLLSLYPVRAPPSSLAELVEYPGNNQWHAKEGYYAPVVLKEDIAAMPIPKYPLVMEKDYYTGQIPVVPDLIPSYSPNLLGTTFPNGSPTIFYIPEFMPLACPQDGVCAMFTGLNDQSTLTLRVRWVLERFPGIDESEILAIATPTSYYDPIALEWYSKIVQAYPSAVMFKENPAGEWFMRVLGELGSIIGPVLAAMPHPLAKAAGGAMMVASPMLTNAANQRKAARKKKKPMQVNANPPRPPPLPKRPKIVARKRGG